MIEGIGVSISIVFIYLSISQTCSIRKGNENGVGMLYWVDRVQLLPSSDHPLSFTRGMESHLLYHSPPSFLSSFLSLSSSPSCNTPSSRKSSTTYFHIVRICLNCFLYAHPLYWIVVGFVQNDDFFETINRVVSIQTSLFHDLSPTGSGCLLPPIAECQDPGPKARQAIK